VPIQQLEVWVWSDVEITRQTEGAKFSLDRGQDCAPIRNALDARRYAFRHRNEEFAKGRTAQPPAAWDGA
jgi:hypothetical protein